MRATVDHQFGEGQLLAWGMPATGGLVQTLLERGADDDVAEAEAAIERLAAAPTDEGLVLRDIWLLRMRALLAQAHDDETAYRDYRDRSRAMGDITWFRGAYEEGRGDAMTGAALAASAGTEKSSRPLTSPLTRTGRQPRHGLEPQPRRKARRT
jgi:hypothetical protein